MPQRITVESSRRTRRTLYLVAGLYVAIGFLLLAWGLNGDLAIAFLGFLLISGTLAFSVLLSVVLGVSIRLTLINDALDGIRGRMTRLATSLDDLNERTRARDEERATLLNLAAFGSGEPDVLAAATLERQRFPRLVWTMDDAPPAESVADTTDGAPSHTDHHEPPAMPFTERNIPRAWRMAVREGDVPACRRLLSTLLDTAEPELVEALTGQLNALEARTEQSLRSSFARCVREGRFEDALSAGARLVTLFKDRPVAEEFERIRPWLERRLVEPEGADTPPLASVP